MPRHGKKPNKPPTNSSDLTSIPLPFSQSVSQSDQRRRGSQQNCTIITATWLYQVHEMAGKGWLRSGTHRQTIAQRFCFRQRQRQRHRLLSALFMRGKPILIWSAIKNPKGSCTGSRCRLKASTLSKCSSKSFIRLGVGGGRKYEHNWILMAFWHSSWFEMGGNVFFLHSLPALES